MKLTRTLTLTAVALMGALAAHGEMQATADVPFGFTAAGVKFPAGVYQISEYQRTRLLTFENATTGNPKFVNTTSLVNQAKDRDARLQFVCVEDHGCALSKIVLSNGSQWDIMTPRVKAAEMPRTAVVDLGQKQAD